MSRTGVVGRVVIVVLLAVVGAVVIGPSTPAVADDNALILPGGTSSVTLGPNAVLRIDGRLRYFRNCGDGGTNDWVYPATDVYIVESDFDPMTGPINQTIEDASGAGSPNTILQPGTAFIEQIIAITGPTGTLGPGTYSIVYDTCQDGKFQRTQGDEIFHDAVTVVYPPVIPPIDDAIQGLKNNSYSEWGRWKEIGRLFDTLLAVDSVNGCAFGGGSGFGRVGDCITVLKVWVESPAIQSWLGVSGDILDGAECASGKVSKCFGVLAEYWGFDSQAIRSTVAGGAKSLIANQTKSFFGIYADPPRSDFAEPSSVRQRLPVPAVRGDGPIFDAVSDFATALERQQLLWDALLAALERYQGAQAAGQPVAALAQLRSAAGIAGVLGAAGASTADLLADTVGAIDTDFPDLDAVTRQRFDAIDRQRTEGLTSSEDQVLRNSGIGGAAWTRLLQETFAAQGQITATAPVGNLRPAVADLVADQPAQDAMLADLVVSLGDVEAELTGDGVAGVPTISMARLTTAPSGVEVSLAATASVGSTVTWDLDADGEFDNGTGPTVTASFAAPGHRVIAAKAINGEGVAVTAHGLVDVTATNAPPTIVASTPEPAATGVVGATTTFVVTATDPTGESLRYRWFVDDEVVDGATGPTLSLTPAVDDRGSHTVQVVVHDPHPGNLAQHAWRWNVTDVDADGDGWSSNEYADCDDTNGDVHPDRPEQLFNDIDDDCDPGTPDRPLELGGGQLWGWGTADGANGTGTGAATPTPRFQGIDRVAQVAASWIAGALVDDHGNVWAWGAGGMPGDGTVSGTARVLPTPVLSTGGSGQLGGVTQLSASFHGFLALFEDGHVVTWGGQWGGGGGAGSFGQGFGHVAQPYSPVPGYVVDEQLDPITDIVTVEGGYDAGYAIRSDGTALQWGARLCTPAGTLKFDWAVPAPQLGTDIVQIEAGNRSLFVRHGDGTVSWCNDSSRFPKRLTAADFGGRSTVDVATIGNGSGGFVLTDDGTIWVTGPVAGNAQTNGLTTELPISPTTFTRVVLPPGAQVTSIDGQDVPCAIFAMRADGTALSWGDTNRSCDGQGAGGIRVGAAVTPGVLPIPGHVFDVSGGGYSSLAIVAREGADVWSWGQSYGAGRAGDLSRPAPIPGLTNVVEVQTWFRHGYALRADGSVYGWGLNDSAAGGFPATSGPVRGIGGTGDLAGVVDLTEGPTMYALRSDGTVASWGSDTGGSLGSGSDVASRSYPDLVVDEDVQPISDIVRVFQMGDAGMAQRADGTLLQWGQRQCAGAEPASVQTNVAVEEPALPRDVVQATGSTAGGSAAILRRADGSVMACGDNRALPTQSPIDHLAHPLGDFGPDDPAVDVDTRGLEWWVVTASGGVWVKTWDPLVLNVSGGAGGVLHEFPVPAGAQVVDVEADATEVQLRRVDGTLVTFGSNINGATGRTTGASIPATADIAGFVIGSSADSWNGLALVIPETLLGAEGWTPPLTEVGVSVDGASGPEGGSATPAIRLDRGAAVDLTVAWTFDGEPGTTVIAAGATAVDVSLALPAPDGLWGTDRSGLFELTSVTGGATLVDETTDITITDVDLPPTMTITPTSMSEGDGALTSAAIVVTLSAAAAIDLDIAVTSSEVTAIAGVDYGAVDISTVIAAGETAATVPLVVYGNSEPQPDRGLTLTATSAPLQTSTTAFTILDDDPLALLARSSRVRAGETATVQLFVPELPAGESVVIDWASGDGSARAPGDYVAGSGTLVIDGAAGATIEIVTNDAAVGTLTHEAAQLDALEVLSLVVGLDVSSQRRAVLAVDSVAVSIDRSFTEQTPPSTQPPSTQPASTGPASSAPSTIPVVITPTVSQPSGPAAETSSPTVPIIAPAGSLPETGGDSLRVLWLALAAALIGLAISIAARRRDGTAEDAP